MVDEPEVRTRLKELPDEITIDEVAHVGQRRNFIGPIGIFIVTIDDRGSRNPIELENASKFGIVY